MPTLYLLSGKIGSGKSTLARQLAARPATLLIREDHWTSTLFADDLKTITVPTWIVHADHDEAIKRENTEFMAGAIPNAGLLIQLDVSHFSMLQAPQQFTDDVLRFLAGRWR